MTLRASILAVARELGSGTHERLVVECFERWPERFGLAPSRRYPDSNLVYPQIAQLLWRGELAYDGPKRWRVVVSAAQVRAAEKLSAVLVAHTQRIAADPIREREALANAECAWCGKPATTRDEAGDPACESCADEREAWAEHDRRRAREIGEVFAEETGT